MRREGQASFRGAGGRKGNRFDLGEVKLAGGMVDVEADDITVGVEIHHETRDDLRGPRRPARS